MPAPLNATPVIVWFRNDLRLADNPALHAAASLGAPILPLYVLEEVPGDPRPLGGASRWWLRGSLERLGAACAALGAPLILRRGDPAAILPALIGESGAGAVFWNRRYAPAQTARDAAIKDALKRDGVEARSFNANLLAEPWTVQNKSGGPFKVFTPFWRSLSATLTPPAPLPVPALLPAQRLTAPATPPASDPLESWGLSPTAPDWAGGLRAAWSPGEAAARDGLAAFLDGPVARYPTERDRPDLDGTARLSPHLAFGEIGPRQIWHAARHTADAHPDRQIGVESFLREIGWREFNHHLLHHAPHLADQPLDERFAAFPWRDDPAGLAAWTRGRTGYPIVDAGMRQLWETGWMHNRVRMIAASSWSRSAAALADGGALVLGHAGGRRSGQQRGGLAMDRRLRGRRRPLLPHLQPGAARREVRSRRRLRPPLRPRTPPPAAALDPQAVGRPAGDSATGRGAAGRELPAPDHRPRAGPQPGAGAVRRMQDRVKQGNRLNTLLAIPRQISTRISRIFTRISRTSYLDQGPRRRKLRSLAESREIRASVREIRVKSCQTPPISSFKRLPCRVKTPRCAARLDVIK